jgi:hypothetical protein
MQPVYLARRKQGGSQAANDNAKGNAKSAGATLRRYGEQALRDVRSNVGIRAPDSSLNSRISKPSCMSGKMTSLNVNEYGYVRIPQIRKYSWKTTVGLYPEVGSLHFLRITYSFVEQAMHG